MWFLKTTGRKDDSLETASIGDNLRINLYYSVLDSFILELNQRFSEKNKQLMRSLQACSPFSSHFLDMAHLKPLTDAYELDSEMLSHKVPLAKHTLDGKHLTDITDVLVELVPLGVAFPTLLKLTLTIPVSTSKCELSFSTLKRTKTYLRSLISEARLNKMAIMSIERDIADNLVLEEVVQKFAKDTCNRRILLD